MEMRIQSMSLTNYLAGNRFSEIKVGQSGADVYEINNELILKHIKRRRLEDSQFDTYAREALYYQSKAGCICSYLPRIIRLEISDDEIILLMEKYMCPSRSDIDEQMIRRVTKALASVHSDCVPEFLNRDRKSSSLLSGQQIEEYTSGWQCLLGEHPGSFDETPLKHIAENINRIIAWHDSEEKVLVHGDFHWDNLLADAYGNILICDWQSVGLGGASGDLSFFMSRLRSDGIRLDQKLFLQSYADAVREIAGITVDAQSIAGHIAAANVITSFIFWHQFLHGAKTERAGEIYEKMTDDFEKIEID